MTIVVGGQTFGIETRSLGTETRNLEIQDGEDVDVLRRPDRNQIADIDMLYHLKSSIFNRIHYFYFFLVQIFIDGVYNLIIKFLSKCHFQV